MNYSQQPMSYRQAQNNCNSHLDYSPFHLIQANQRYSEVEPPQQNREPHNNRYTYIPSLNEAVVGPYIDDAHSSRNRLTTNMISSKTLFNAMSNTSSSSTQSINNNNNQQHIQPVSIFNQVNPSQDVTHRQYSTSHDGNDLCMSRSDWLSCLKTMHMQANGDRAQMKQAIESGSMQLMTVDEYLKARKERWLTVKQVKECLSQGGFVEWDDLMDEIMMVRGEVREKPVQGTRGVEKRLREQTKKIVLKDESILLDLSGLKEPSYDFEQVCQALDLATPKQMLSVKALSLCSQNSKLQFPSFEQNLIILNMSNSRLVPANLELYSFEQLQFLNISNNNLQSLPAFHIFPSLKELIASHNKLSGAINGTIITSSIKLCDFSFNNFTEFDALTQLINPKNNPFLAILDITGNPLAQLLVNRTLDENLMLKVYLPTVHTLIKADYTAKQIVKLSCFENFGELAFKIGSLSQVDQIGGETISNQGSPQPHVLQVSQTPQTMINLKEILSAQSTFQEGEIQTTTHVMEEPQPQQLRMNHSQPYFEQLQFQEETPRTQKLHSMVHPKNSSHQGNVLRISSSQSQSQITTTRQKSPYDNADNSFQLNLREIPFTYQQHSGTRFQQSDFVTPNSYELNNAHPPSSDSQDMANYYENKMVSMNLNQVREMSVKSVWKIEDHQHEPRSPIKAMMIQQPSDKKKKKKKVTLQRKSAVLTRASARSKSVIGQQTDMLLREGINMLDSYSKTRNQLHARRQTQTSFKGSSSLSRQDSSSPQRAKTQHTMTSESRFSQSAGPFGYQRGTLNSQKDQQLFKIDSVKRKEMTFNNNTNASTHNSQRGPPQPQIQQPIMNMRYEPVLPKPADYQAGRKDVVYFHSDINTPRFSEKDQIYRRRNQEDAYTDAMLMIKAQRMKNERRKALVTRPGTSQPAYQKKYVAPGLSNRASHKSSGAGSLSYHQMVMSTQLGSSGTSMFNQQPFGQKQQILAVGSRNGSMHSNMKKTSNNTAQLKIDIRELKRSQNH